LYASSEHESQIDRAVAVTYTGAIVFFPAPSFSPDHVHPILVNFTAALVPTSFASDVLGRALRKRSLHDAAYWMLVFATAITPFTAIAGLLWKRSVGDALPASAIHTHQWLGISLAAIFIVLALWRWKIHSHSEAPGFLYLVFAFLIVLALTYQGTLGGAMVFG
jgi:uncharacterized membrane protein